MLRGISAVVDHARITAIVNTGDDSSMHGLHISPDLDTVTYTLADAIDPARGWGLVDESWRTMEALTRFTPQRPEGSRAGGTWFNLGDRDLATHLYRSGRMAEGAPLSVVTAEMARAWGLRQHLVPMSDDPVRTRVHTADGWLDFQDYFVGRHHAIAIDAVEFTGADRARVLPAAAAALTAADVIVVAPSNPIVSIGPLLALAGVRPALTARRDCVVAVSPIIAGSALKGPADRMLAELGHEPSVVGVARLYAPFCATLVIDHQDASRAGEVEALGVRCVVTDTIMSTPAVAAALARTTLEAAG
jgi:LPPG:FO 2-phospho-L-lactate transferase